MGTIFRCCLVITAVTLWLTFATVTVQGSLSTNRRPGYFTFLLENNGLSETPYSECDSENLVKVTKVEVTGCDSDPCELKAGTTATFNLGFTTNPKVSVNAFHAQVYGVIGIVPVPFHVPHADGCVDSGCKCPLTPNTDYDYTNSIPVLENYPRIGVKVKWELVTDTGAKLLCVIIPAKIVS